MDASSSKTSSRLRGPASQAQQLYEETEESMRQREAAGAQLRLERRREFDLTRPAIEKRSPSDGKMDETGALVNALLRRSTTLTYYPRMIRDYHTDF